MTPCSHPCSKQPKTRYRLPFMLKEAEDRSQVANPAPSGQIQITSCEPCSKRPNTDHRLAFLLRAADDRPQVVLPVQNDRRQIRNCRPCSKLPKTKGCHPCPKHLETDTEVVIPARRSRRERPRIDIPALRIRRQPLRLLSLL